MAFDVSGLAAYVDQNRDGLIGKTVAGAKSTRVLDLQTGFKSAGAINRLDTDVILQDGSSCGRTASGTTTLDQRILTVGEITVAENLCVKDLNAKYTQHQVKPGSKDDEVPFEEEYTSLKTKKINQVNEVAIWQGDTDSVTVNLKRFDGLIKLIDAEASVIDGNTSAASSITSANVIGLVNDMYAAIPAALLEADGGDTDVGDLAILMGSDTFRTYVLALAAANLYHYDATNSNLEIMIPATNVKAMALGGITGTDRMFAGKIGSSGGFVVGVDLENEEEEFDMWYSKDDKVVKFDASWKMGTQIKWPEEIVEFTLGAEEVG